MPYTVNAPFLKGTGEITKSRYGADDSMCLTLEHGDGDVDRLTVCLAGYGMTPPEGHVFVKDYAECEGLPKALHEAGVCRWVEAERIAFGGFDAGAVLMRVLI